jgi:4-amino-4-deoxy-L-arabinose transferase-like glycosyltransferase
MRDSHRVLLLSFLCFLLYLPALGNRDLWGTVETEYAQVARETLQSTSWTGWLIPHFNGDTYNEKPPLYFWLMALVSLPVGDVTEFTARLPSALTALGTVIVLYFLGKALWNEQAGLLASLILLSSPEFFKSACMVRIDLPVALLFALSMAGFYMGLASSRRWFFLLGWFSAALSFLAKGPLYPLLIGLVLCFYAASRRELHRLKETLPFWGAVVFFGTICLWFIPVYLQEGHYLEGLLNWGRWYLTEEKYHVESFYFYPPQFLAGMAPWSIFIPLALYRSGTGYFYYRGDKGGPAGRDAALLLPWLWLLFGLIAFSLLSAKHSRYVLFLYPAGALIAGLTWEGYWAKSAPLWPWQRCLPVLTWAVLMGVVIALFAGECLPHPTLILSLVGAGMLITFYLTYRASQTRLLFGAVLLCSVISQAIYYQWLMPSRNSIRSEKPLCQLLLSRMEPGAEWAVYRVYRPAFTYYTRTFPRNIHSEEQLEAFLSSMKKVYCLFGEADYQGLAHLGQKVVKLAEFPDPKRCAPPFILVSNKP